MKAANWVQIPDRGPLSIINKFMYIPHKKDSLFEASRSVLEAKDEYALMKELEEKYKQAFDHFKEFHKGHEKNSLNEIQTILLYCTHLAERIKKML